MLREHKHPLILWTTPAVKEDLSEGNPLFKVLEHYCGVQWHAIDTNGTEHQIHGAEDVVFTPLALTSNAPPYSPHRDKPVAGDTIGMKMFDKKTGKSVFYAPGLGEMEPHVWQAMSAADVILVDGTMWTDDEMISRGASTKTARSMGHLPQSGNGGMLEWLDKLPQGTRKILIHINNTNPILDENSEERRQLQNHHVEVAYDGMEISI